KVDLHLDTDARRRLRGLTIRSELQRSRVTRNSSIACVEINIGTGKLRPSQPASRPILRNCDGTRTVDSTAGDVYTNLDRIAILFGTTDTKTLGLITLPGIWHVSWNITILRFSVTRSVLVDPTFRLWHIIIQITKHHRGPTPIYVEPSNFWTTINSVIQFTSSTSTKLNRPSSLSIELPELEP
ncbi:MAG: hypothetical protein EZS28_054645, partial [Streblomastix strix]